MATPAPGPIYLPPDAAKPLRASGESLPDPNPPPNAAAIRASLAKAERWLRTFHVDPYGGAGIDSLRVFALEVECWHRLGIASRVLDPSHEAAIEREVRSRLQRFCDARELEAHLRTPAAIQASLEVLRLTAWCAGHGVDTAAISPLIHSIAPSVGEYMDRLPAPTASLFAAALADLSIDIGRPVSKYEPGGVIASRPREIDLSIGRIYGVSQEILARTSGGDRPLVFADSTERGWCERVLPYLAMTCTILRKHEAAGDLLTCIAAAGLDRSYGYREGLRVLVSRQNPDGSWGDASRAARGRARIVSVLPATTSAITALALEARRAADPGR